MDCENLPVQVIVHCDAGGGLRPLRFRYEDAHHQLHTVCIDQITDSRKAAYVGIDTMAYLCKGGEHLYELRFTVQTHKWVLFRKIY